METGQPLLGSFARLSSAATRPIALGAVADIALRHEMPIVGTAGVMRAEDALKMVMAGASAVGVHTEPLLLGLAWFGKTPDRLERWPDELRCDRLTDLRAKVFPHLRDELSHAPLTLRFEARRCTRCERCVTVCAYGQRRSAPSGALVLDQALCRS